MLRVPDLPVLRDQPGVLGGPPRGLWLKSFFPPEEPGDH